MDTTLKSLLLECLHQDTSRLDPATLTALTEQDWKDLIALAGQQRVTALFLHNLQQRDSAGSIPQSALQSLNDAFLHNTARNLWLSWEFARIVQALEAEGVSVLALKGVHLMNAVYEQIGLREMDDLDVYVPRAYLSRSAKILTGLGLHSTPVVAHHHLPPFISDRGLVFELHHTLALPLSSASFDDREIWERAQPMSVDGVTVLVLSPEDALLDLCAHNARHAFAFGLRPYCDLQAMSSRYSNELDWEKIVERARRWNLQRATYLSLRLAVDMIGADFPQPVLQELESGPEAEEMQAVARVQVFTDWMTATAVNRNLSHYMQGNAWQKVRLLAKAFFPSWSIMSNLYNVPSNAPRLVLKYPHRWATLLSHHWRTRTVFKGVEQELKMFAERTSMLYYWLDQSGQAPRP